MAGPHSNALSRARSWAPTSGVLHIRTRLTANFTVVANALAQRRGSAVTVGVAVYILSLPDGAPVSIAALRAHFTEDETVISRALRDLEAAGFLERRRERLPDGMIRTRTYAYDLPGLGPSTPGPAEATRAARPVRLVRPVPPVRPTPAGPAGPGSGTRHATLDASAAGTRSAARPRTGARPGAAGRRSRSAGRLRTRLAARPRPPADVSRQDVARLAPAEVPLSAPTLPPGGAVPPWQTCYGGCERAFRAAEPGRCRDCSGVDPETALRTLLGTALLGTAS
ncbi:hypothetical protein GCM10010495_19040 [Kitasatospora herbaricolor]|uniref:hypothetical protein n=1 Tax=Kitasatospora herbaricolor TaxID=68217 RepID=UPI00174B9774|nr:hypothetical protein [Kitasatospora herbaricolor]MDQ0308350.1 hypothetical protein [Kitasatospora herbaricolor]GGV06854.1 hypothetical protein GCM10010495_19040 [Kitasatospora herbaricolor]